MILSFLKKRKLETILSEAISQSTKDFPESVHNILDSAREYSIRVGIIFPEERAQDIMTTAYKTGIEKYLKSAKETAESGNADSTDHSLWKAQSYANETKVELNKDEVMGIMESAYRKAVEISLKMAKDSKADYVFHLEEAQYYSNKAGIDVTEEVKKIEKGTMFSFTHFLRKYIHDAHKAGETPALP